MNPYFNEKKWLESFTNKDWYLHIKGDIKQIQKTIKETPEPEKQEIKDAFQNFFVQHFDKIQLSEKTYDFDEDRKEIDTIVLHHTSNKNSKDTEKLNVQHMLSLYMPQFWSEKRDYYGKPIGSDHIVNGNQVFYGYHWLIRRDGTTERLLEDTHIGWHAGNWDINTRSIAICLDNNYEDTDPSDIELEAINTLIREKYPQVSKERVFGHRDFFDTICPGNTFETSWKPKLLKLLSQ